MKETNKEINKAKKVLEELSQDEHERYLAELRQKYIMDQKAIEDAGFDKGFKAGEEYGMQQGIQQGMQQGIHQEKIAIAKNMKKQNIDIETICKITGLTIEEIKNIKY